MTLKQLDVEIGLQLLDRLGDGRLRDRQRLRGMGNRAGLGHRDKELELSDRKGHDGTKHQFCRG